MFHIQHLNFYTYYKIIDRTNQRGSLLSYIYIMQKYELSNIIIIFFLKLQNIK